MTDIEKQFFSVFGVKSKMGCTAYEELGEAKADLICNDYCPECDYFKEVYPQITDSILLELICILTAWHLDEREPYEVTGYNKERLKRQVLEDCIQHKEKFRNKVQALFMEEDR